MKCMALGIEHVHMTGCDENRVAGGELEVERLVADEFELDPVVAVDREIDAHDTSERGETLDPRAPAGPAVPLALDLHVVRSHVDLGIGLQGEFG